MKPGVMSKAARAVELRSYGWRYKRIAKRLRTTFDYVKCALKRKRDPKKACEQYRNTHERRRQDAERHREYLHRQKLKRAGVSQ